MFYTINSVKLINLFTSGRQGWGLLPDELESDSMGFTYKTVMEILDRKHPASRKLHCYMLEAYEKTSVFNLMDITKNLVKLVVWKLLGSAGPSGTDSEA